jgi:hypothetical protein
VNKKPSEVALEAAPIVRFPDAALEHDLVRTQGQNLLLMGAAHAVVEAGRDQRDFDQGEGQNHPVAVQQEKAADNQRNQQQAGDEPGVGPPGPGLVRAQDDDVARRVVLVVFADHRSLLL